MKIAIAIFAKTPGLSPVKTRLAADIGTPAAEEFYLHCLKKVDDVSQQVCALNSGAVRVYWAVAEACSLQHPQWRDKQALWTGEGGLGERMHHVQSTLLKDYDAVMLLGSDCPALSLAHLQSQFERLKNNHQAVIFGPCDDGGFYSVLSTQPIPLQLWQAVSYSQSTTLAQFKQQLINCSASAAVKGQAGYTLIDAMPCYDVDTIHEYQRYLSEDAQP